MTQCLRRPIIFLYAGVAQLVERLLPKQNVTGSSPVTRFISPQQWAFLLYDVGLTPAVITIKIFALSPLFRPAKGFPNEFIGVLDVADYVIEAQARGVVGKKVKQLRREGVVPATIYGPNIPPLNVQIPYRPLQLALMKAGGTNLIDIKVDDKATYAVLAREVQRNPIRGDILHVDFFAVDLNAKIRTEVPVHLHGQSPIVTARKGLLITGATSLTVEVLASKLIQSIDIDLNQLTEIGASISVGDLKLGDDITILNDPEELIVRVVQSAAARSAEEAEEAMTEVSAEPEVIARGKSDEDEED